MAGRVAHPGSCASTRHDMAIESHGFVGGCVSRSFEINKRCHGAWQALTIHNKTLAWLRRPATLNPMLTLFAEQVERRLDNGVYGTMEIHSLHYGRRPQE